MINISSDVNYVKDHKTPSPVLTEGFPIRQVQNRLLEFPHVVLPIEFAQLVIIRNLVQVIH